MKDVRKDSLLESSCGGEWAVRCGVGFQLESQSQGIRRCVENLKHSGVCLQ